MRNSRRRSALASAHRRTGAKTIIDNSLCGGPDGA
jgi:hypothetical protein